MSIRPSRKELIYTLWDELAGIDTTNLDDSRDCLLKGLCHLVDAQNATWVGSVRIGVPGPQDPMFGWRPYVAHFLYAPRQKFNTSAEIKRMIEQDDVDDVCKFNTSRMGNRRAYLLREMVSPAWFKSDEYKANYLSLGHKDGILASVPVNEDAEAGFCLFRDESHDCFTEEDKETIDYALRGLRWFHRQQLLGHGLMLAKSPLTPTERSVLELLLQGLPEKKIATLLGKSYYTVHDHVTRIFRKFDVKSRASLQALWLTPRQRSASELEINAISKAG